LLAFFAKQPACLIGMEACAAAHHWGRELRKLGHRVKLMPPRYVKTLREAAEERCRRCRGDL
jgi:transposase